MEESRPEENYPLFKWRGAELIVIPIMMIVGVVGNALVLYITHCRWRGSIFSFFIKVKLALAKKLTTACVILGIILSIPGIWIFGRHMVTYGGDESPATIYYCFILHNYLIFSCVCVCVFVRMRHPGQRNSADRLGSCLGTDLCVCDNKSGGVVRVHSQRPPSTQRSHVHHPPAISCEQQLQTHLSEAHPSLHRRHGGVLHHLLAYFVTVILSIVNKSLEEGFNATGKAFFDIAKLFPLLSNAANPIIYSFTSERFRVECKKVFKLRPCRKILKLSRKDSSTNTNSADISQSEDS
ncbi:hypothetical protein C0Q70_19435 [Pomacea canaliculata]|uniref:G-protein coupled receptors family 1 profile domain-containing protein n=1 Tax=Pomacea canaliculata TaxID=400727 RepID=A0A2T7NJB5_POMCA|nr:hypothetical protein C0Q70_19435 [Pomacea canaliculata]